MFCTVPYAVLFSVAVIAVWGLRNRVVPRTLILIALSSFFFILANFNRPIRLLYPARFSVLETAVTCLGLLFITSFIDFHVSKKIDSSSDKRKRRILLWTSLITNLSILGTFKYFNFFSAEIGALFDTRTPHLDLLCPIGISFYTFQTISYVIDVYRKKTAPAALYTDYLLYLVFFPKLLMGPIVRASDLLPKLTTPPLLTAEGGSRAVFRIGIGLVKKLAVADFLRVHAVDPVFSNPGMYSSFEILIAVYAYAFQIYADFSAYTDIAVGSAALLGIEIPENFNAPYMARSLREFWHRWHITLSSWLRDYLYIPLGGSRRPAVFVYANLMITMILGGLWHGASMNFLVWGAIHGAGLVLTRMVSGLRILAAIPKRTGAILGTILTFHLIAAAWIFFRAPTFKAASDIFQGLATFEFDTANISRSAAAVLIIAALSHAVPARWYDKAVCGFHALPAPLQALVFVAAVYAADRLAAVKVSPFIYSQF